VVGRQLRYGPIIGFHPWQRGGKPTRTKINRGKARINHLGRDTRTLYSSDDAIAIPMGQPGRRIIAPALFHEIKRPGRMFAYVSNYPLQQIARIGVGRFDD